MHRFLFVGLISFLALSAQGNITDSLPPHIDSVSFASPHQLNVYFSEAVEIGSAEDARNYRLDHNWGMPVYAIKDAASPRLVHLSFINDFPERVNFLLTVDVVRDLAGNEMMTQSMPLLIYRPMPFDILIDEIMADPSPPVGMPEVEWVEIRNVSSFPINLMGWRLAKTTGRSGPLPNFILLPDSSLIICSSGSLASLLPFGPIKSVTSFPSLSNAEDCVYLMAPDGQIIHTVAYADTWYQNDLKKQGGWSLEMIDLNNPCQGIENWQASNAALGATPSKINSVDAVNMDLISPQLLWAYAQDSLHVLLQFNEPLDSAGAADVRKYQLSDGLAPPLSAMPMAPLFDKVLITLVQPLAPHRVYTITANGVGDCLYNMMASANTVKVGMAEMPDSNDVVVNEILFNPKPEGVDFIEIYNRSKKIINMKKMSLANRNTLGQIDNIVGIADQYRMLFPDEYMLITADAAITRRDYVTTSSQNMLSNSNLPSMNDDEGFVMLLNEQGHIVDQLHYNDNWHFEFITNTEGVSLERIDANATTQDKQNWHSASESVGYATPGYRNSQSSNFQEPDAAMEVSPKMITPDNDGIDDYLSVNYHFPEPGNVANIMLYDAGGRMIKWVANNLMCGTSGRFIWNGLGKNNSKLPAGPYILYSEVFNANGKKRKFKNVVVVE